MATIELGADLHRQCTVAQCLMSQRAIGRGLRKVTPQSYKHTGFAFEHGVDGFNGVVAIAAWRLETKALCQPVEEVLRRPFVDAHGAVTLDVAVPAHRAEASTRAADVPAQ